LALPDALLTGVLEGFGLDDDVQVHRDQILRFDYELGHPGFLLIDASDAPTPANFCQQGS
jgi:hypothetical protein